jgi:hypothetical protein
MPATFTLAGSGYDAGRAKETTLRCGWAVSVLPLSLDDPTKPPRLGQPLPLTPEYQAIFQ